MKSKANLKGHPLHPILIPFPIAFFTGTLILDVAALSWEREDFRNLAYYLELGGIAFALLAAIPGIIDFLHTVPPKSSAKKRAATHGVINVTMLILFSAAFALRQQDGVSFLLIIITEAIGMILLSFAGWMGGTLVYRNQIGVDVRYANSAKWKEKYLSTATGKIEVGNADELQVNQMILLHLDDKRIVLCKTEQGYAAFDDRCPHKGGSLAGGSMMCGTVQCPWHGSQFEVETGAVKAGPANENIKSYSVTEVEGKVFLNLPH